MKNSFLILPLLCLALISSNMFCMDDALLETQALIETRQNKYESLLNDNQIEQVELPSDIWRLIMNNLPGDEPVLNNLLINQFVANKETYEAILKKFIEYLLECPVYKILPAIERFVNNKKNKQNGDICLDYFNKIISLLKAVDRLDASKVTKILDSEGEICDKQILNKKLYQVFYKEMNQGICGNPDRCVVSGLMFGTICMVCSLSFFIVFAVLREKTLLWIPASMFALSLSFFFIWNMGRKASIIRKLFKHRVKIHNSLTL